MNSRDARADTIAHETPDRPPVSASFTPEIVKLLRSTFGRPEEDLGYVMGNDLIKTTVGMELSYHRSEDPVYTCPFGVTFRNVKNFAGAYTEIVDGVLRDDPDGVKLAAYKVPDPDDPLVCSGQGRGSSGTGGKKYIIGSCQCSIFEDGVVSRMAAWRHAVRITERHTQCALDKVCSFPHRAGLNLID
jgi:uroporphyrinogen decarboxylase